MLLNRYFKLFLNYFNYLLMRHIFIFLFSFLIIKLSISHIFILFSLILFIHLHDIFMVKYKKPYDDIFIVRYFHLHSFIHLIMTLFRPVSSKIILLYS